MCVYVMIGGLCIPVSSGYDAMYDRDRHGNGNVNSPSHRFSSVGPGGRSTSATVGPSTPSAGSANMSHRERDRERERLVLMSPSLPSPRKATTLSQSPIHGGPEREREGERGIEKSPNSQRVRTPVPSVLTSASTGTGPAKFGALPLPGERERDREQAKLRAVSPVPGSGVKALSQSQMLSVSTSAVSPRIGLLSGPGRAITPATTEGRNAAFSSPRSANGISSSNLDMDERERRGERERGKMVVDEVKMGMAGPGVLSSASGSPTVGMTASSKMSVPQMVD